MAQAGHPSRLSAIASELRGDADASAWPNLFIVGAVKCGTTSLHSYLAQHPRIYMSPVKEPYFFSAPPPGHPTFDEASYLSLFRDASTEWLRGESSPLYLWDATTPQRIREVAPKSKIIIMLRDPTERAYSHYLMDVEQGSQTLSFLEAIRRELDRPFHLYVELGRYRDQVERYLSLFSEDVMVIFFESFFDDVEKQLKEVFRFLKVEEGYAKSVDLGVHNAYEGELNVLGKVARTAYGADRLRAVSRRLIPGGVRGYVRRSLLRSKRPPMDAEAEALLKQVYREEPEGLRKLLGRDVPWMIT
jgi:hypothetical protein